MLLSYDDALRTIMDNIRSLGVVEKPLPAGMGQVAAENIYFEDTNEPGYKNGPNKDKPSEVKIYVALSQGEQPLHLRTIVSYNEISVDEEKGETRKTRATID